MVAAVEVLLWHSNGNAQEMSVNMGLWCQERALELQAESHASREDYRIAVPKAYLLGKEYKTGKKGSSVHCYAR